MNISFIGGDKRNVILSNLFKKRGFKIYKCSMGLDTENTLTECINNSKYIILPIPYSSDDVNLNTKLSDDYIRLDLLEQSLSNKIVIGGGFSKQQKEKLEKNSNEVFDLMKCEDFVQKNVIPTVEGIIKIVIEDTIITIDGSNIAILGFGRIGKRAALELNGIGANIFCYDINKEELANISLYGYNVIENLYSKNNYDIIINTVPKLIIGEKELSYINSETLIIDVASNPGGIDFEYAQNAGYRVIHELGIPGKVAPKTVAKYMEEYITSNLLKV